MSRIKLFSLLVFSFVLTTAFADDKKQEFTKEINKNFDSSKNGMLKIKHRHGNLNLTTWDKNEVEFKIKIEVMATSQSKAEKIFKKIDVEFDKSDNSIIAKTNIDDDGGSWFGGGWNEKEDFKIHYEVKLPKSLKLDLSNKYGNIYIPNIDNNITINQSYGNIKIGLVKGNITTTLKYGDGHIKSAKKIKASVSYGALDIGMSNKLTLSSKYSEMTINQANFMTINSSYDNYRIGKVNNLSISGRYDDYKIQQVEEVTMKANYSDLRIEKLLKKATCTMRYGDFKIENLGNDFEMVDYTGSYADIRIETNGKTIKEIQASSSYGDIRIPEMMKMNYKDKSSTKESINATHENGKGKIKAKLSYADLVVK